MSSGKNPTFWREALAWNSSVTPKVVPQVLLFSVIAGLVCIADWLVEEATGTHLSIEIAPYEIAGAALGLLLILRTNAGYDRWWEAGKLWGGIVNQSRNLAIDVLAYARGDSAWQNEMVRWVAAFPHVARASLRGEKEFPEVGNLLGASAELCVKSSSHAPCFVTWRIARLLQQATARKILDPYQFLQIDKERALLIDHIGACERILKTPLAKVYSIKIRRFIALFLLTLPFALMHKLGSNWLVPLLTMLVAYPLLSLDQIGMDLQNPFARENLGHLPLGEITSTIEKNLTGLLMESRREEDLEPLSETVPSHPTQQPMAGQS